MKDRRVLTEEMKGENLAYIGRRHAQRLISDLFAKGIARGAVECLSLLTRGDAHRYCGSTAL